jgi:hypothetical protein
MEGNQLRSVIVSAFACLAAAILVPAAASAAPAAATSAPAGNIGTLACYGPKSCIGLGAMTPTQSAEYYLQTWNGRAWGPVFGRLPGSESYTLSALWCSSATRCVAVGNTNPAGQAPAPLAETWNGTSWSAGKPQEPAGSAQAQGAWLNGISCASARFCVAVGDYTKGVIGPFPPLQEGFADTWNGTKWTITKKVQLRSGSYQSYLDDVSCRSSASCVAVGGSSVPFTLISRLAMTAVAVTEVWNGRKWTQVNAPATARGHGQLTDVSCWSARNCVAAGYSYRIISAVSTVTTALADSWNGRRWTVAKLPATGPSPALNAVSCVSARSCLAVGINNTGTNRRSIRAIADSWNGRSWKAVPVAVPSQGGGARNGDTLGVVQCASPTDCVAIGLAGPYHGQGIEFLYQFAERWNGTSLKLISDS